MTQHTQGPWELSSQYVKCKDGYNVASVNSHKTTEGEANARLIAAAPELLAELVRIRQFLNDEGYARPVLEIEAVIAKATGGI